MARPKAKDDPAVMDVSKPSKKAVGSSSKSVIINNRQQIKDPTVVTVTDGNQEEFKPEPDPKLSVRSSTKAVIQPIGAPEIETAGEGKTIAQLKAEAAARKKAQTEAETEPAAPDPEPAPDNKATEAETIEATPEVKEKDEAPAEEKTEAAEPAKAGDKPAATEMPGDQSGDTEVEKKPEDEKQAIAEAEKEAAMEASVQKLIESKKYELPINSVEKRRSRRVVALGIVLSIILALAWLNVALDANLINIKGINPVTDFF